MSKIFDAYRKQTAVDPKRSIDLATPSTPPLYPSPSQVQIEEFNQLANRLLSLRREEPGLVITTASSAAGEGASFVSYSVATCLARSYRQKVLWVDGNFISPQQKLGSGKGPSFSDLLSDPDRVFALQTDESPLIVRGGNDLEESRGSYAGESCRRFVKACRQKFDFTIIDAPPVLKSTDTALLASGTDGLLLVIEQKYLKWEVIRHGIKGLQEKEVNVLGTVINRRRFDLPKMLYDRL